MKIVVVRPAALLALLAGVAFGQPAVFQACSHCHNVQTDARKSGPSLRTLFGKVRLANGKRANEQNVVQLISEGYNGMPSYRYILRPEDWNELLPYLKTLRARPEVAPVLKAIRGSDGEILSAGKKLYNAHCINCHDTPPAGIVEEKAVPLIRNGHGGMPPKNDMLDEPALFSLIAFVKAR